MNIVRFALYKCVFFHLIWYVPSNSIYMFSQEYTILQKSIMSENLESRANVDAIREASKSFQMTSPKFEWHEWYQSDNGKATCTTRPVLRVHRSETRLAAYRRCNVILPWGLYNLLDENFFFFTFVCFQVSCEFTHKDQIAEQFIAGEIANISSQLSGFFRLPKDDLKWHISDSYHKWVSAWYFLQHMTQRGLCCASVARKSA